MHFVVPCDGAYCITVQIHLYCNSTWFNALFHSKAQDPCTQYLSVTEPYTGRFDVSVFWLLLLNLAGTVAAIHHHTYGMTDICMQSSN
jgi:hypothetical protein